MKPRSPPSPDRTFSDFLAVSRRMRVRVRNAIVVLSQRKKTVREVRKDNRVGHRLAMFVAISLKMR